MFIELKLENNNDVMVRIDDISAITPSIDNPSQNTEIFIHGMEEGFIVCAPYDTLKGHILAYSQKSRNELFGVGKIERNSRPEGRGLNSPKRKAQPDQTTN